MAVSIAAVVVHRMPSSGLSRTNCVPCRLSITRHEAIILAAMRMLTHILSPKLLNGFLFHFVLEYKEKYQNFYAGLHESDT